MTELLEIPIKISVIVAVGLLVTACLRHHAAAIRHWILAVTLAYAGALPLFEQLVPSWSVALPTRSSPTPETQTLTRIDPPSPRVSIAIGPLDSSLATTSASVAWFERLTAPNVVLGTWTAGFFVSVAILILGGARLSRIASRSRRLAHGPWVVIADEIRRAYGLRRPVVVLQSTDERLLVTWGLLVPKVILPARAAEWAEDRVRLVLSHELAHARRADWIVQLGAEVLRAVYWFNPLLWVACARLRQESEKACDDVVLCRGVDGPAYAAHLVQIARDLGQRRLWMAAPAIARTSSLERRVKAMLDSRQNRRPLSRTTGAITLVALLAISIPIAAFAVGQAVFSSLSGSIVDPTSAALPGVRVMLTNAATQAKYEIQTDRTGRYEFVGLPSGDYVLDTQLAGFASLRRSITIATENAQLDLRLEIGTLQETVAVVGGPADSDAPTLVVLDSEAQRVLDQKRLKRAAVRCPPETANTDSNRIGGNIRAPMKIRHAKPHYPSSLRVTSLAGTVVLQGRIGTDGIIEELNVVSSTHPDFVTPASEAVAQWQFDQTLLNCVPMEVNITVTVNFSYHP